MADTAKRQKRIVKNIEEGIKEKIPTVRVNGDSECRLPCTINLHFNEVSGESLMHLLDMKGICVSTSSACNSGKDRPPHVLLALGLSVEQAKSSIRISYGKNNSPNDVDVIVSAIVDAYAKILTNK